MKTGFKEHLISALLLECILVIIYLYFGLKEPILLLFSGIALILGSLIPDIDHPFSVVRKTFRSLLFIFIFAICLLLAYFFKEPLFSFCQPYVNVYVCILGVIFISLLIPLIFVSLIDLLIPFHRGPLHSFSAMLIYATIITIFLFYANIQLPKAIFIGMNGLFGFLLHILLDFFSA